MDEFRYICAWCGRERLPDGLWIKSEDSVGGSEKPVKAISHGICHPCMDNQLNALERLKNGV